MLHAHVDEIYGLVHGHVGDSALVINFPKNLQICLCETFSLIYAML